MIVKKNFEKTKLLMKTTLLYTFHKGFKIIRNQVVVT